MTAMITGFSDPFDALFALQRALDASTESDWMGGGTAAVGSYPAANIFKQGDDFVAVFELPGISSNDIAVEAKENSIRISGKKVINYGEGASVHRRERVSGVFDRTLSVPIKIDPDGVRAEYSNGVLALFLPRAAADKPRTIKIN
jgi:HSP20 family protein